MFSSGMIAFVCAASLLSGSLRVIDPPAADTSALGFFLKAAEYRPVPAGLAKGAGSTLVRAARFLLSDTGIENEDIKDEAGHKLPPYVYHAVIDENNHFGYRSSFPAFHHAYMIEAFLNYYNYSGNPEALHRAVQLADWTIAHSSPADDKWAFIPWSTFTEGKPGGMEDKDALQPDKTGYMGLAYTRLYEITGRESYFDAAKHAADTLVVNQGWEGDWPFRVNPKTGEVAHQYTAALFENVAFLEKMYALTKHPDYKSAQILAWMWMMRNPIRTNNWSGLYEDIASGSDSQVHYSPVQTIRLLLRYRTPLNAASYLDKAQKLFDVTMDGLGFDDRDMGLMMHEQTAYLASTPSSTMNWSMMAAEMYLTTGEERYRQTVLEALRMVTQYGLKPDGRSHNTVLGARTYGDWGSWYSLTSPIVRYAYQDMGCLPELSPSGETHLLRTSTQIRDISYGPHGVRYESLPDSVDLLKLASAPTRVQVGGKAVVASAKLASANGYWYNERSRVLVVRHSDPRVEITLGR